MGVSGRARVIVYNPTLAPNPPDTIDGLLAPEWKGKIGFAPSNASWQSFVTGLRVRPRGGRRRAVAYARSRPRIRSPSRTTWRCATPWTPARWRWVWSITTTSTRLIQSKGADAVTAVNKFMAPGDPGGLINVAGVGVLKSAPNPQGAQAFAAYLVAESAQRYFAEETAEYPLVAGVAPSAEMPPLSDLQPPAVDLSQLDDIEATQELLVETGLLTN